MPTASTKLGAPRGPSKQLTTLEFSMVAAVVAHPEVSEVKAIEMVLGYTDHCYVSRILRRPRVAAALEQQRERRLRDLNKAVTREIARCPISRADIISGLHKEAANADTASARVSAWMGLADIFGMRIKQIRDVSDLFNGWTETELDSYYRTGAVPLRFAGGADAGAAAAGTDTGSESSPE